MDKLKKAKELHDSLEMYSSKHIKALFNSEGEKFYYFADRWYGTYDSPDWTYHFQVTAEEAREIVNAGYAEYWMNAKELINGNK